LVDQLKCFDCGSGKIGKGKLQYEAKVHPVGKTFATGSDVLVDICTDCGLILKMKVEKPEKFK
jgi:hypothetical protein